MGSSIHKFQGYWMRSHSETRWASMLDALGIRWIYEPQVVETRHGWYLPDFYLPGAGVYLEVKGPAPTQTELEKGRDLQEATGCPVIFAWGDMQFSLDGVCGGMLGCLGPAGFVEFSTFEFRKLIRLGLGEQYFNKYLRAGIKHQHPGAVMIGDYLQEVLLEMVGRSAAEASRADHHKELNAPKVACHSPTSKAEWAIASFLRRNPGPGVRVQEVAA
ncbi:hypothetical protein IB275_13520 [Pseudomonas sp. PDM21]|uniref:hypothetical protein n=1 Tax=Pseudomonas sp. PDM21 TaxID=2769257 RepID=UPI0017820626|nr:hypothetical protein [Pseudomonas sp. PDM21]MBD9671596.1 hypothetical protein [Pseudomonas sp. PDM21]